MKVYISLGGNFKNSDLLILQALEELELCEDISNIETSRMYTTDPVDIIDSDAKFKNICMGFNTKLTPKELLDILKDVEKELGKTPKPKNTSRPIDIDILFFGDTVLESEELTIPHPRWSERSFVIEPLMELTESIIDPKTKETISLASLLEKITPSEA